MKVKQDRELSTGKVSEQKINVRMRRASRHLSDGYGSQRHPANTNTPANLQTTLSAVLILEKTFNVMLTPTPHLHFEN